jgi:hypothetical protein
MLFFSLYPFAEQKKTVRSPVGEIVCRHKFSSPRTLLLRLRNTFTLKPLLSIWRDKGFPKKIFPAPFMPDDALCNIDEPLELLLSSETFLRS